MENKEVIYNLSTCELIKLLIKRKGVVTDYCDQDNTQIILIDKNQIERS